APVDSVDCFFKPRFLEADVLGNDLRDLVIEKFACISVYLRWETKEVLLRRVSCPARDEVDHHRIERVVAVVVAILFFRFFFGLRAGMRQSVQSILSS